MSLNTSIIILGVLVVVLPCIRMIKNKKVVWENFLTFVAGIALLFFSLKKSHVDYAENKESKLRIDILLQNSEALKKRIVIDSTNTVTFEKRLDFNFHIIRDSITNQPRLKGDTYNTNIKSVQTLNMGPHN